MTLSGQSAVTISVGAIPRDSATVRCVASSSSVRSTLEKYLTEQLESM